MAVIGQSDPLAMQPYGTDEVSVTRYVNQRVRDYARHKEQLAYFLANFENPDEATTTTEASTETLHGRKKYLNQLVREKWSD